MTAVWVIVGCGLGLVMGALPGLTVTMTVVLIVSLTYGWEMFPALGFILGAFAGGVTGGALSAITMNIPGTAAAVATIFDGYPLNKRGEAANAIGISLVVGLLGALFGILFLVVLGPIISGFALQFWAQEYFLLMVWGLSLVAILSKGKTVKGLIATMVGLFVGMIGMDSVTGLLRFTFGMGFLSGGVNYIVAMIGLFGMKEVFSQLVNKQGFVPIQAKFKLKDLLPKPKLVWKSLPTFIWSAPIGAVIGLLPGTGGDIAALVSYGFSKQLITKPSRPFGEGAYEGVASPEIANHSAMGGAITTALTLGIPGDSVTAVLLGAFYLHGLLPGPTFLSNNPEYFSFVVWCLIIGVFAAYIMGLLGSNLMLRMLRLPQWFLVPLIALLCVVGSYALQNSVTDVFLMLIFGLIGFAMDSAGYPVGCMVLAILLGPMMETNLRQAMINSGSVLNLLATFVTRPISLVLLILLVGSVILQARVLKKVVASVPVKPLKD